MMSFRQSGFLFLALFCGVLVLPADAQLVQYVTADDQLTAADPLHLFDDVEPVGHFANPCAGCDSDTSFDGGCDSCCHQAACNAAPCGCCHPNYDCCLCRAQLTGDWGGRRKRLAECCGIVVNSSLIQFYQ